MKSIKVIIVDDHHLFREGLVFLLKQFETIKILGEASNGQEFLDLLQTQKPDVVLMDISMPEMNGIEATLEALKNHQNLKIVALSMYQEQEYFHKMTQAGAKGFITKKVKADELYTCINAVYQGDEYYSKELLQSIVLNLNEKPDSKPAKQSFSTIKLSNREQEVLELICQGLSSKEIANNLYLSSKTVEGHKHNLFAKTGVNNTVSLAMFAIKNKLVGLPE